MNQNHQFKVCEEIDKTIKGQLGSLNHQMTRFILESMQAENKATNAANTANNAAKSVLADLQSIGSDSGNNQ